MQKARIERILRAQAETGRTINRLMLTLVGLGFLSCLTLGFPDSYLLTSATTVTIPFAGPASFRTTLIVLPVILIGLRAYLQIYVDHWRRLDRISRGFRFAREPTLSALRHPVLRLCTGFVLYALIPLVLGVLTYEAMVFPGWGPMMLALAITVALAQALYPIVKWRATVIPSILMLAIVAIASHIGLLDTFRRPFELQLANLDRANLEGQDLDKAFLVRASLRESNSKFAKLRGANLWRADFAGSNLKGAVLESASLGVANLTGANAECTNFRNAILERATFQGTDLKGADLREANLQEANLKNAKLSNADLSGANITGADLAGATFCCTRMPNGNLNNRDCQQTGMTVEKGCNPKQYCQSLISHTLGDTERP